MASLRRGEEEGVPSAAKWLAGECPVILPFALRRWNERSPSPLLKILLLWGLGVATLLTAPTLAAPAGAAPVTTRAGQQARLVVTAPAESLVNGVAAEKDLYLTFARLLERHIKRGEIDGIELSVVDYAGWRDDPLRSQTLEAFDRARPERFETKAARLAFWINAYNLLAIEIVLQNQPLASIRDAGSWLRPVWKRPIVPVAGRIRTLDEIEHDILRPRFAEPRVHFAIVCASVSCPDLRSEPYLGVQLDVQLEDQTRRFLANRGKGIAPDPESGEARISKLFDWFGEDFVEKGGVVAFLRDHAGKGEGTLASVDGLDEARLEFLAYDWSLNDAARLPTKLSGTGPKTLESLP